MDRRKGRHQEPAYVEAQIGDAGIVCQVLWFGMLSMSLGKVTHTVHDSNIPVHDLNTLPSVWSAL
jgi:hypothetical protein